MVGQLSRLAPPYTASGGLCCFFDCCTTGVRLDVVVFVVSRRGCWWGYFKYFRCLCADSAACAPPPRTRWCYRNRTCWYRKDCRTLFAILGARCRSCVACHICAIGSCVASYVDYVSARSPTTWTRWLQLVALLGTKILLCCGCGLRCTCFGPTSRPSSGVARYKRAIGSHVSPNLDGSLTSIRSWSSLHIGSTSSAHPLLFRKMGSFAPKITRYASSHHRMTVH